jgi:hypothetical protein
MNINRSPFTGNRSNFACYQTNIIFHTQYNHNNDRKWRSTAQKSTPRCQPSLRCRHLGLDGPSWQHPSIGAFRRWVHPPLRQVRSLLPIRDPPVLLTEVWGGGDSAFRSRVMADVLGFLSLGFLRLGLAVVRSNSF